MISKLSKKAAVKDNAPVVQAQTAAMRVDKDLANLEGVSAKVSLPDKKNLLVLNVTVTPLDGIWLGGTFNFRINVPDDYPHTAPKATYLGPNRLWHPNIEGDADKSEWGVCLNILRKDWRPVLSIRDIVFGLEMMFFEPNMEDPLPGTAREAAQQLKDAPREFERKTKNWMKGNYVN
jgi:ubiquitin-conjugating enzyme E2 M